MSSCFFFFFFLVGISYFTCINISQNVLKFHIVNYITSSAYCINMCLNLNRYVMLETVNQNCCCVMAVILVTTWAVYALHSLLSLFRSGSVLPVPLVLLLFRSVIYMHIQSRNYHRSASNRLPYFLLVVY